MKRIIRSVAVVAAFLASSVAFAQILDEKNVVITMDLQPVLQLKMEGPDQIDFTFNEIAQYYGGITKYGANILKVSSSVSFDLWAVGLSQGNVGDFLWDQQVDYQGGAGVNDVNTLPITALELHQFPANPRIAAAADCGGVNPSTTNHDYSKPFAPIDQNTGAPLAGALGSNAIYTLPAATPYIAPIEGAATAEEKYIAGGQDAGAVVGCGVVGGSYLTQNMDFTAGVPDGIGYYFVMDYRIVPGLPVVFPMHQPANNDNSTAPSLLAADLAAGGSTLGDAGDIQYVAPGVYSMYIKYILAEDQ
jgi:hypothetical protein